MGPLELKGLPEPVPTVAVAWEPSIESTGVPLPAIFAAQPAFAFAGRDEAWLQLKSAWVAASSGDGQIVLIAGEPGIGKTRIAAELAHTAVAEGGAVLYGGCDEDIDLPYRPFASALSHLARHLDADAVEAHALTHGRALAPVVPLLASAEDRSVGDSEIDRLRLFEAACDLLARGSARTPTLLVLDDLHWADGSTLRLLRHLVREAATMPLLVLATYRDTDVDRSHPLSAVLADLRRAAGVVRLSLSGLDAAAIGDVLTLSAGHDLDDIDALATLLRDETDGNPFFVGEVIRHLIESGAFFQTAGRWSADRELLERVGVPEGVRDVIGRRLSALPDALSDVLRVAAVVGHEFDASIVAEAGTLDIADTLDHLDTATQRGLLADTGRRGRWRFAHALVRQTLAEELSLGQRLRMHQRVALALEAAGADTVTVAHHCCEAAVLGDAEKAVELARAAGREAMASLAWEQAVRWFERGLEADESASPDARRRAALLVELGEAMNAAGDAREARRHFGAAADLAGELGDAALLLRAALGFGGSAAVWLDVDDPTPMRLLEAAEAVLPAGDSPERVAILVKRSNLLTYATGGRRRAVSSDAVAMARRLHDDASLAMALWAACDAMRGVPEPDRFRSLAEELIALPRAAGINGTPLYFRGFAEVVGCNVPAVRATAAAALDEAERSRDMLGRWQALALLAGVAAVTGDPAADVAIEAARSASGVLGETGEFIAEGQRRLLPALASPDIELFRAAIGALQGRFPSIHQGERLARAFDALCDGQRELARTLLRSETATLGDRADSFTAIEAADLSVLARWLRDPEPVAALRRHLSPWRGMIVTGAAELWMLCGDHYLAELAIAEGDLDTAAQHLRDAIDLYQRNGIIYARRAAAELEEISSS